MKKIRYILIVLLVVAIKVNGQTPRLTDYLLKPSLDTLNWTLEVNQLNSYYSRVANQCQTCVYPQTELTKTKYCINTSTAHVRLDTNFHNITPQKLVGKWKVVSAGGFEISDSLPKGSENFIRTERITDDQKDAIGTVNFTEKVVKMDIQTKLNKIRKRKRFVIVGGKHLMTKKMIGMCGPTMIGITDSGYLILDVHSYKNIAAKNGDYFVFKTYISRTILRKIE